MDNGFKALVWAVLLAAAVFAGVSVWPGLAGFVPGTGMRPAQTSLAATPNPQPQPAAVAPTLHQSTPVAPVVPPAYTFLQEQEQVPPRRWMYANGNVILRKEPNGDPFIPDTLSFAPLTVHNGTRLWPVKTKDEWVLVQSPGQTLGWVHKDEVFTDDSGRSGSYYSQPAPRRPWL